MADETLKPPAPAAPVAPQKAAEGAPQRVCPRGHPVRTSHGKRKCSQVACAFDPVYKGTGHVDRRQLATSPIPNKEFDARVRLAGLLKNLRGDDAVKWAESKLVDLLPEAVTNVAWELRFGTDKQRSEATDRVLRANGMDRREAKDAAQSGLIVLNLSTQNENIPWLQRLAPKKDEGNK